MQCHKLKYLLFVFMFLCGLAYCATCHAKDPKDVGFAEGLTHTLGLNTTLENNLAQMEARSEELKQELEAATASLEKSVHVVNEYKNRLRETKFKTQDAADKARLVSNELQLKQMKLNDKKDELADMEQRVLALKAQRDSSKETIIRMEIIEQELKETKQEIAVLDDVLENNLYLEAENALQYD